MALGDGRSNGNNKNKLYENQYYSRIGFKDYTNNTGKRLGFSYKSGMLLIDISKEKDGGFDYDTLITIYITPTKAKILLHLIEEFKTSRNYDDNMDPNMGFGINTGMGEIQTILAVHVDENNRTVITIGKIDAEGKYTQKEDFILNENNFHYGIKWTNIDNMECDKQYYNNTEFDQFERILEDFANASNGAYAYSHADITRYDLRSVLNKMNPIYDALGIERRDGNNNSSRSSGSGFFNNNRSSNGGTSQHKSYDDLPFGEDDEE